MRRGVRGQPIPSPFRHSKYWRRNGVPSRDLPCGEQGAHVQPPHATADHVNQAVKQWCAVGGFLSDWLLHLPSDYLGEVASAATTVASWGN